MQMVIDILSWGLMIAGSAFVIIGAVGTLRFPEFWSRLHAASVTDSAGMILLVAGMCLQAGLTLITVKLIIIGVFLFITGPTSTHAVANAAFVTGLRPPEGKGLKAARPEPRAPRQTDRQGEGRPALSDTHEPDRSAPQQPAPQQTGPEARE